MSQAKPPAVAPPRPAPSSYLLPLASQSSANLILLSLALLLSSGVLIKTFHPTYRFRTVTPAVVSSRARKRRESVLKSIILAQEAVADNAAAAGVSGVAAERGAGGGRSRSTSSVSRDGGRGRSSSSVASTSAAIVQGLSKLSAGAVPAHASSASRQESIASGSKSPSVAGTPSRDGSGHGVSFADGKKGKSKKGKGVASAPSLAAPTVGTPTSSPSDSPRRRPMKDASTSLHLPILSFIDAAIQTEVPFLSLLDTSSAPPYPPSFVPLPSSPPAPSPPACTANADVQTSPSLLPQSLPRLLPYDLHASFQSTPPPAHVPPIAAPLSPSTSHELLQTPAPRSRKQARKASAATLGLAQPTNTVVGMPRPPKPKDADDEQGASTFPRTPSPASRKSGMSLSRMVDSPETASLALPLTNGSRQGIGLAANGCPQKGKGRELGGVGGGACAPMGGANGRGRNGIPAPILIPAGLRDERKNSMQSSSTAATAASSYSNSSTSPHLSHPGLPSLPPMTPPDVMRRALESGSAQGRGSAQLSKEEEEADWRNRSGQPQWDSGSRVVGLGVEVDRPHDAERGRIDAGRSWSEAAGGSGNGSRGTSPNAPGSVELPLSSVEGAARGLLVSPGSYFPAQLPGLMMSPVAAPIPLPMASGAQLMEQSWPPQLVPSAYAMVPFPLPSTQPTPPLAHPPTAVHSSSTSSQSRPSSRQSSLPVPLSAQQQQQQQQQHLLQQQQHQAYAYAQAHAQYQHTVALQYQAQQHHQAQQQQLHQRVQSDQSTPGRDSTPSFPPQGLQTPQMVLHGWTSHPSSPGVPPPSQYAVTQSPTSATFPPPIYAYYATSAASTAYISSYHMPQTNHQGGRSSGKMRDARKSPRMGMEKQKSFSGPSGATGPDLGAWKARMRTAEMDADRAEKELEIARWRLAVLEEERIAGEVENQEALAALATRAMRAEARLKALEDARHQDSSSTSGSGSPVTRPSSVMESTELPSDPLPPPIVSDEPDPRFPSSPSSKVHPLVWLDLTTISLTTQSQSASSSPYLSSPGGSSRKGRGGRYPFGGNEKDGRQRRYNANGRRRSMNSVAPADFELEDDDDEEVVIVLDSPLRRKMPPRPVSRRSSFLGDDDALDPEGSVGNVDDEELSMNGDFDDGENGERAEHVDYIGSLPTFLKTTHPAALVGFESPRSDGEAPQELVSVPSFVLDCGTPSPHEEKTPQLGSWSGSEGEEATPTGQATTEDTPTASPLISMRA